MSCHFLELICNQQASVANQITKVIRGLVDYNLIGCAYT